MNVMDVMNTLSHSHKRRVLFTRPPSRNHLHRLIYIRDLLIKPFIDVIKETLRIRPFAISMLHMFTLYVSKKIRNLVWPGLGIPRVYIKN